MKVGDQYGGGTVVHLWHGDRYILRDDTDIRRSAGIEPQEAYSLFAKVRGDHGLEGDDRWRRLEVLAGPIRWAARAASTVVSNREEEAV